jgi:hypothetical protein
VVARAPLTAPLLHEPFVGENVPLTLGMVYSYKGNWRYFTPFVKKSCKGSFLCYISVVDVAPLMTKALRLKFSDLNVKRCDAET